MWWMFAPRDSMFAAMSAGQWISSEYKGKLQKSGELQRHFRFLQEPGDVVFVPREWAHAVNNVQPSLAVAVEFSL